MKIKRLQVGGFIRNGGIYYKILREELNPTYVLGRGGDNIAEADTRDETDTTFDGPYSIDAMSEWMGTDVEYIARI